MSQQQKTALITGAGARIGRALALRLAREGYAIGAHYRSSEKAVASLIDEIEARGGHARGFHVDLARPEAADHLAGAALAEWGRIDLLINNASVWTPVSLDALTPEKVDRILAVNLRSPFLLSVRLGRAMVQAGGGGIIHILDAAIDRPRSEYLAYAATKAGLAATTRGLASALAPTVRVNAVAPGPVLLPEATKLEQAEAIRRTVPLARIGKPEDVVGAVLYLLDAPYVTGTTLTVDGGRSIPC
jgi:NAD(P)-dependent dehydrogenase (short-subunit alcohol dehydrogenase family)